jgi:serine/threonine protein phosphatase PrpC
MDRVKYQFPVWFYATRSLFQKSTAEPWVCAVQLRDEFQHINLSYPRNTVELKLFCGAGRTRGKRNYMEDVDFVFSSIKINDQRSISVFGVLDGHGGKECSQFCADDIPVRVAANMRNGSSCPEALYKAFLESDQECLESGASGDAGSTANVAVYDQQHNVLYVANAGDTRAVLSRGGVAMDLSYDRKGTDPEEIARVAKAGGFVKNGRLQGSLAVSRALGTTTVSC